MEPRFRIIKNKEGKFEVYYVELCSYYYFFTKEVLRPFITYAGTNIIFAFSKLETAVRELEVEVIKNTKIDL